MMDLPFFFILKANFFQLQFCGLMHQEESRKLSEFNTFSPRYLSHCLNGAMLIGHATLLRKVQLKYVYSPFKFSGISEESLNED